jgi:hypothetical protein
LCSSAVAEVRRRQPAVLVEVKVPQWHPPGAEAEVDFGQVGFWLDGVLTDAWMFVFRLSASGKGFHRVYLNQAQQAFLDGHVILEARRADSDRTATVVPIGALAGDDRPLPTIAHYDQLLEAAR